MINNDNLLLKKILYRAKYRGCKETDFLLGNFFTKNKNEIINYGYDLCQDFLDEDDMLIYDWILGKAVEPNKYQKLLTDIKKFNKIF
jgi:antitoxin CptB